ncbi:hypothetical protein KEJ18_00405 [Candidatus Bathyarchaeota archaeon]|nr:hypothetical protein [Candidatus Bathyarchaeota archaeon]
MNHKIIVMTMILVIASAVLGLVAAEANQRILPHELVYLELNLEVTRSLFSLETLKITSLRTIAWDGAQRYSTNFVSQEEFRQGDIMGILLNYTYTYSSHPQGAESWKAEGTQNDEEYVYLGETLVAYFKIFLEVYDSQGNLVANTSNLRCLRGGGASFNVLPNTTNISMYRGYYMLVPYNWAPGNYTIKTSIKELISGFMDTAETTVNITIGPPPEAPHPISVHPKLMIIGSEDLPTGWVVAGEDFNLTTLEGYAMSVKFFTKPVGDFKKEIQLQIIQFSNVESAIQYFESKLDGMLLTEKYGHVRVTMQEIGDSGFLVDSFERRNHSWIGWDNSTIYASGSSIIFRKDNLVVIVSGFYRFEAIKQGIYVTNEDLIEFANIQAAKISAIAKVGD